MSEQQMSFLPNSSSLPLWQPAALATKSLEPMVRQSTKVSQDAMAFAAKRAGAWTEHGRRLATCKQPADVVGAGQAFWQQAVQDYTDYNRNLMSVWMGAFQAFTPAAFNGTVNGTSASVPAPRDILPMRDAGQDPYLRDSDPRNIRAA